MFTQTKLTIAPIALSRVDDLLAKVFSIAAAVLALDVLNNAASQMQLLEPIWFWFTISALSLAQFGSIAAAFWFGHMVVWYRAITLVTLFALVTWPFQVVDPGQLGENYKPWIWWAVGFASLATVGAFTRTVALTLLCAFPVAWVLLRTSAFGGSANFFDAIDEALYSFFFSTSIALLVMFLRHRAAQVDREFRELQETRIKRALLDVAQFERIKIASILHESVIAALDAAANAQTPDQRQSASHAAAQAIARLNRERSVDPTTKESVSSQAFFESLKAALERRSGFFKLQLKSRVELAIPVEVAIALAEATFQALTNSLEHAAKASRREVKLSSTATSLKIVLLDNGPGFRMARVPQSFIGVRLTIFKRLESLGIRANLQSAPGEGTTWVFEWSAK